MLNFFFHPGSWPREFPASTFKVLIFMCIFVTHAMFYLSIRLIDCLVNLEISFGARKLI